VYVGKKVSSQKMPVMTQTLRKKFQKIFEPFWGVFDRGCIVMYLIQGSKELLKIVRWVAGVHFMHNLTYLRFVYVIHFKEAKILV